MSVEIVPVTGLPEFEPGDDLGAIVADAVGSLGVAGGDVVAVTQKIVSKAEGRVVREAGGDRAAWVERETRRVVARRGELVIAETHHGFVCANAGVDASNVAEGWLTLLPEDPDASAERIRAAIAARLGVEVGTVVTDTFGRPWREGLVNVAIGCAGLPAVVDLRGTRDQHGRELEATVVALADEIAAASGLVMGKAAGVPVAIVRGVEVDAAWPHAGARALVRRAEDDLFREAPLWAVRSAREASELRPAPVPRSVLEEAVAAAVERADVSLTFVVATSDTARRRVADEFEEPSLVDAGALVVPFLSPASRSDDAERRDTTLLAGAGAIERLVLGLHSQAFGWRWSRGSAPRRDALGSAFAVADGWTALGVVAVGEMRTGAASARPPSDLSALLRFE